MSGSDRRQVVGGILDAAKRDMEEGAPVRTAQDAPPGVPVLDGGSAEPGAGQVDGQAGIAIRRKSKKSRAWESRPENKPFTYRVGQDVHQLILAAVEEYRRDYDWKVTTSDVARAWLVAGHQAWLQGEVEVEGTPLESGAKSRG